ATGVRISTIPVDADTLWSPDRCPAHLLPYLAWACSVDRWDRNWPEETRRQVIGQSWKVHRQKGTVSALRETAAAFGYEMTISEWWEHGGQPGTFTVTIGADTQGIGPETWLEMEDLLNDARPVSRHMTGLYAALRSGVTVYCAAGAGCDELVTIHQKARASLAGQVTIIAAGDTHTTDSVTVLPGVPSGMYGEICIRTGAGIFVSEIVEVITL
nr:phage tail protein I [Escherichia coli]